MQVKCDTPLESSRGELQLWFRPRPDLNLGRGIMSIQSLESPNRDSFRTPPWESWEKEPFGASPMESCREYYMGEGGGFPQVRAVVSQVSPS